MNEKVLKCLFDIKLALAEIDSFFDFHQDEAIWGIVNNYLPKLQAEIELLIYSN